MVIPEPRLRADVVDSDEYVDSEEDNGHVQVRSFRILLLRYPHHTQGQRT